MNTIGPHSVGTVSYLGPKNRRRTLDQMPPPLVYYGGPVISSPELVPFFWGPISGTEIGSMMEWLYGFAGFLSGEGAPVGQEQVLEQ